jgi:hypothetical protein
VVLSCVYIDSEIGCVLTHANCKSVITKEERGFVKVITDKKTGAILGAQMMYANDWQNEHDCMFIWQSLRQQAKTTKYISSRLYISEELINRRILVFFIPCNHDFA